MTNTISGLDGAHELLIKLVDQTPEDWEMRKKVVRVLYDAKYYRDASKMIWNAPEIPPLGDEVVFATKIVAKGQPTRAMRLVNTVIEKNLGHPDENLSMAKLFVKAGMPLQAIRFYGAAVALDGNLVDECFEVALLNADIEERDWIKEVSDEEFPWDGPDSDQEELSEEEAEDAHAELLNGLTQPVPMKAPVRPAVSSPKASVESKKSSGAETPKNEPRKLPEWKMEPGRATFDPKLDKPSTESPVASQPKKQPDTVEVVESGTFQESAAEEPIEPQKVVAVIEQDQPIPTKNDSPDELKASGQGLISADEMISPPSSAFFKSYDDAHQFKETVQSSSEEEAPSEIVDHACQPVSKSEKPAEPENDVSAYVAETMAEYESSMESDERGSKTGVVASALASLVGRFRRTTDGQEDLEFDDNNELALSADDNFEPGQTPELNEAVGDVEQQPQQDFKKPEAPTPPAIPVEKPAAKEETSVSPEAKEPPVHHQAGPKPLYKSGVHTSAQRLVANTQQKAEPEVPKELDGRTQLVALAPEDGRPFFEQLKARYANVNPSELPMVARVARDMANADYLGLINRVCVEDHKDLDAFSKLLGLHRAMTSAGCHDWAEDMNLLRKGYGDAVLATVVSRYSVAECREILNSVYQAPAPNTV